MNFWRSLREQETGWNARAADVKLTAQEVKALDDALNAMEMSEVFGGTKVVVK